MCASIWDLADAETIGRAMIVEAFDVNPHDVAVAIDARLGDEAAVLVRVADEQRRRADTAHREAHGPRDG